MRNAIALIVVALALALTGCGVINWTLDRTQCGLKCPSHKSCQADPGGGGVFFGGSGCYPKRGWVCGRQAEGEQGTRAAVLTCDCWDTSKGYDGEWMACSGARPGVQ